MTDLRHAPIVSVPVASATEPGTIYDVQPLAPQFCPCKGFHYRGTCRHLAIALQTWVDQAPRSDRPLPWAPRPTDLDDAYYAFEAIAARRGH